MNLGGKVGHGPGKNSSHFCADPNPEADTGSCFNDPLTLWDFFFSLHIFVIFFKTNTANSLENIWHIYPVVDKIQIELLQ